MQVTNNNYKLLAAKLYRNPVFLDSEFEQDFSLIKRVVGKIEKYSKTGKFSTRLVFNNFTIACNCFGLEFVEKCLFLFSNPNNHDLVMTFLNTVSGAKDDILVNKDLNIKFDPKLINRVFQKKILEDLEICL
jgi:hypothetical protein